MFLLYIILLLKISLENYWILLLQTDWLLHMLMLYFSIVKANIAVWNNLLNKCLNFQPLTFCLIFHFLNLTFLSMILSGGHFCRIGHHWELILYWLNSYFLGMCMQFVCGMIKALQKYTKHWKKISLILLNKRKP